MQVAVDKFNDSGKTLMVEYECCRCGNTYVKPLMNCVSDGKEQYYGLLLCEIKSEPDPLWAALDYTGQILCPECTKAYKNFMERKE